MPPMMMSISRLSSVMDSIYCACAVFCTPCIKTWYQCRCMLALHLSPLSAEATPRITVDLALPVNSMQLDDQISEHQTTLRWTSQIPGKKYSLGEGKIGVELHAKFPLHPLENYPFSTAHQVVEEF